MRDAQPDVDLTDGSWPAAVIEGLPVGLLEMDARGRVVRANTALVRLLASAGEPVGGTRLPRSGTEPVRVADRWPLLAEPALAVLGGRTVDQVVTTRHAVLHVRGGPRWTGTPPYGGVLMVSDAADENVAVPAVVDLRDGVTVEAAVVRGPRTTSDGSAVEGQRRAGAGWLLPSGAGRRRPQPPRADVHAATHDAVTGLPNQVLLLQCLTDALRACPPGRRVALVTLDVLSETGGIADAGAVRRAAALLVQVAGPDDMVARLEGDRLAVLLREVRVGADLEAFGSRVADWLRARVGAGVSLAGPGLVVADPAEGGDGDRNPRWVLALALEALERSRAAGRPVLAPELPTQAERERVAALWSYDVNDAALDDVLRGITQVAVTACDAAAALLTFVDCDLQWVRAATGLDVSGLVDGHGPRHLALCDRTIRGRDVLVVADMDRDPMFRPSRHIGWQLGMRFYAGAPLLTSQGRAIGTLCVLDRTARSLTERQRQSLSVLAAETVALLEAHRSRL